MSGTSESRRSLGCRRALVDLAMRPGNEIDGLREVQSGHESYNVLHMHSETGVIRVRPRSGRMHKDPCSARPGVSTQRIYDCSARLTSRSSIEELNSGIFAGPPFVVT